MRGAALAGACLACLMAAPAVAKPPSPGKALKRVTKSLNKLKSYRVTASVKVGQANGPQHRFSNLTVDETFSCDVVGKVAAIGGNAFRLRKGNNPSGAIQEGSRWKAFLATKQGRLIGKLFLRPEEHLMAALKSRRRAKWLPPDKKAVRARVDFGDADEDEETDSDSKNTRLRKGKKRKSAGKKKRAEPVSNRIRIVGPAQVAIQSFNRVVTSGCFSEG